MLFGVAIAATPEMGAAGHADANALVAAMAPWANGRQYLNFLEEPGDPRTGYDADSFARLQSLRAVDGPRRHPDGQPPHRRRTITLPTQR